MYSHKLALFGILVALMLAVAACNGDDEEDADVPGTDTTPEEEVTPDTEDEMTPEMTPEDGMTPEETPGAMMTPGMTPEETPGAMMTPEGTPGATMTPEGTPDVGMGAVGEQLMVDVTLADMEIELDFEDGMMTSEPSDMERVTLPSGNITFQVTNDGDTEHSFDIERDEMAENGDTTSTVGMEEAWELGENLEPGDSTEWEVELEPGDYVFYCQVDDHREQGMEIQVTVEDSMGSN